MARYALSFLLSLTLLGALFGQSGDDATRLEIEELKQQGREQRLLIEELQRKIARLEALAGVGTPVSNAQPAPVAVPEAAAAPVVVAETAPAPLATAWEERPAIAEASVGRATFRLADISLDVIGVAGGSNRSEQELQQLQGGGHDPTKAGFSLPQAELSLAGAVDPYFNAEAHIVYGLDPYAGESHVELEEAFATTSSLPRGLQAKAGHFLTEFGRVNPQHPHSWDWIDQPVINSRIFGGDGMRAPGARLSWLTPLPWFSQFYFTAQNATGETMVSFLGPQTEPEEEVGHDHDKRLAGRVAGLPVPRHGDADGGSGIGGWPTEYRSVKSLKDLVYTLRSDNAWDLSSSTVLKLGGSLALGPNATGPTGRSRIWGLDMLLRHRPENRPGDQAGLSFLTEFITREYHADPSEYVDPDGEIISLPRRCLRDWGFNAQFTWGFAPRFLTGLRAEYASGSGDGLILRAEDPLRADRFRLSPLLMWKLSHFSVLRFQYNFDKAHWWANQNAHTVWVGLEFMIGAHPTHNF